MAYIRKYVAPNAYNNQDREVGVLIARQNLYEHVAECNWKYNALFQINDWITLTDTHTVFKSMYRYKHNFTSSTGHRSSCFRGVSEVHSNIVY